MTMFEYTPLYERYTVNGLYASLFLPAQFVLIAICAAFRPSTSRTILTGFLWAAITLLLYNVHFDAPYIEAYSPLTGWGFMIPRWVDRVFLANQDREKWHKVSTSKNKENGKPSEKAKIEPPVSFWPRLKWSWSQTIAWRGYGYSWQVKKIPPAPPPGTGRWTFVLKQLVRFYVFMTLADIGRMWAANTPFTGYRYWEDYSDKITYSDSQPPAFFRLPLSQRIQCCWLLVFITHWSLTFPTSLIYAVMVALGSWKPEECPPPFGNFTDMYSIRNAWGTCWHQFNRRLATFPGTLIAKDILRLRSGTFLSKYVQLFAAFATMGACHSIASMLLLGHDTGELAFWLWHAVAIMFEDHVVILAKRLGFEDNRFSRFVGFVWTIAWFSVSLQWIVGPAVEVGSFISSKPPDPFGVDAWFKNHLGA